MPFEIGETEREQRNPMTHINPNPQLLGALNPLLRCPLGLLPSVACLLALLNKITSSACDS